jgi:hypothetical protein
VRQPDTKPPVSRREQLLARAVGAITGGGYTRGRALHATAALTGISPFHSAAHEDAQPCTGATQVACPGLKRQGPRQQGGAGKTL